jgi:hypothetical protein
MAYIEWVDNIVVEAAPEPEAKKPAKKPRKPAAEKAEKPADSTKQEN